MVKEGFGWAIGPDTWIMAATPCVPPSAVIWCTRESREPNIRCSKVVIVGTMSCGPRVSAQIPIRKRTAAITWGRANKSRRGVASARTGSSACSCSRRRAAKWAGGFSRGGCLRVSARSFSNSQASRQSSHWAKWRYSALARRTLEGRCRYSGSCSCTWTQFTRFSLTFVLEWLKISLLPKQNPAQFSTPAVHAGLDRAHRHIHDAGDFTVALFLEVEQCENHTVTGS